MASCRKTPEGIELSLEENETHLFHFLGQELNRLLEKGDPSHPQLRPFHPAEQRKRDPEAAKTGLEKDMDAALLNTRLERISTVKKQLFEGENEHGELHVILDDARADLWLAYLADLRLLLSAVVGITPENPDPFSGTPEEDWTVEMKMYEFLSILQEWIIAGILEEPAT